jgi:hypothetical protein
MMRRPSKYFSLSPTLGTARRINPRKMESGTFIFDQVLYKFY